MQFHPGAVAALLCAACLGSFQSASALVLSAKAAAESSAAAWLRAHKGAPQQDELGELKGVNPEAYAIVKALLTKRSLGLLDPMHPTASFSAAPPAASVPGPEAFQKIGEESGEKPKVAPLYPDAPVASGHHDWLNWKPQQSATDDESMVQNVLGSVAALKQGVQEEAPSDAPVEQGAEVSTAAPAVTVSAPLAKPAASMSQENSYLNEIDFGLGHKKEAGSKNYLASFSWDDEAPAPMARRIASGFAPKQDTVPKTGANTQTAGKKDALLAWLNPASAKKVVATTQAPAEQNSYLKGMDLN